MKHQCLTIFGLRMVGRDLPSSYVAIRGIFSEAI